MNRKFSLEKVKANQAKVAQSLLGRDDELRRGAPIAPLLASRRDGELTPGGIGDRPTPDGRALNPAHLVALAESISRLGLITPITVDCQHRLIAGGHRRAALRLLALAGDERDEAFRALVAASPAAARQGFAAPAMAQLRSRLRALPVRSAPAPVYLMAVDALADPQLALRIEVAENEHRKQYSRDQVLALAQRLRDSGFKDTPGRPKAGERALRPELIEVFGISRATVTRYLRALDDGGAPPPARRPARFARLRRELRIALPLMAGEAAATAQRLDELLAAAVAAAQARDQRAQGASDPLAASLQSALAAPSAGVPADDAEGGAHG